MLNFNFDRSTRATDGKRDLSDAEVKKLGKEINRINLCFLSLTEVECRRRAHLQKLQLFSRQFSNLRKKGIVLETVQEVDEKLLKTFGRFENIC